MPARDKLRLDQLVFERGLARSREQAKALVLAGKVKVGGIVVDKPGSGHPSDAVIEVERGDAYVSRGGEKLAHAVDTFKPRIRGLVAVDIGASTGGFTDVLLREGADMVYAVDVGRGQLAWKLQQDVRVKVMDRTNARYLTAADFDPRPEFGTVDVSFISLSRILPALYDVLLPGGHAICLVKPQFEAGREKVGKRGVVRSPEVHREVLEACMGYAAASGFTVLGVTPSPIRGPEGNVEFLMYLAKPAQDAAPHAGRPEQPDFAALAREAVELAHAQRTDE